MMVICSIDAHPGHTKVNKEPSWINTRLLSTLTMYFLCMSTYEMFFS